MLHTTHHSPPLRTILVRYDFDDNTSIDSGAEGECFAKGADVKFAPHPTRDKRNRP